MLTKKEFALMLIQNSAPYRNGCLCDKIKNHVSKLTDEEIEYLKTFVFAYPYLGLALDKLGKLDDTYHSIVHGMYEKDVTVTFGYVTQNYKDIDVVMSNKMGQHWILPYYSDPNGFMLYGVDPHTDEPKELTMNELFDLLPDEEDKLHDN